MSITVPLNSTLNCNGSNITVDTIVTCHPELAEGSVVMQIRIPRLLRLLANSLGMTHGSN
ncbi:MAG: hypothetical protein UX58_C0002G0168 [Candidatus Wolfebacteria bacterium GW2011_GWB2_46_69]|uniref:Uncharacterized protein n=1 Tax=Candidatus Wolfebacteria bacterium GW2011_GWA2_47_9b TaxID=1619005 RepID=A0A0G1U5V0_9BACT|nr:MAG: hypothetical protein UX58_C0002G0168 [Candidatus Wolfebacteria bacterium GW2011_GWB2_46_69]KKU54239.1 MAG: hypothetical protein UX76_C0004G0043 [Candidatus Wolfebacteria bacterium GW2011_GWC1_47_103]KKU59607.1 MAG: hypothetical protein UX83_C0003G0022 [Candidatus Wolfebacteria bacterium GW2011_GWE2_47_12]KKU66251.1 MAG: hypothetical protein UX90_C0001G0310 [Candidatus Wolfebacteria bacterium GW2011_GWD2_47_17]KKU73761.1 MAG: hypothetical protein UX96_C0002G0028 [Candidatus Wolfebacteria